MSSRGEVAACRQRRPSRRRAVHRGLLGIASVPDDDIPAVVVACPASPGTRPPQSLLSARRPRRRHPRYRRPQSAIPRHAPLASVAASLLSPSTPIPQPSVILFTSLASSSTPCPPSSPLANPARGRHLCHLHHRGPLSALFGYAPPVIVVSRPPTRKAPAPFLS